MDNRYDFNFYRHATAAARNSDNKATPYTSFYAFRMFADTLNAVLRNDFKAKEKEKAGYKEELSSKRVQEKSLALDEAYNSSVKGKQNKLTEILDKLAGNIRDAYERFTMIPPSPEGILRIENAAKRLDTMTETEFLLLAKAASNNYQETALLQSEARKHGRDYNIPFEPEEAKENLDKLVKLIKENVIDNIGESRSEHYEMANFFLNNKDAEGYTYGKINPLVEYFEALPIYIADADIIPELVDKDNLQGRLVKARQICWENNQKALWEEAVHVGIELQNKGLNTESISKAEKIIKIVSEMYPDKSDNT